MFALSEIQIWFFPASFFPDRESRTPFQKRCHVRPPCLIFLFLKRSIGTQLSTVERTAVNRDVVGSNPTVSAIKNFPKNKKDHVEGECLSAVVRMGFYYVYGEKTRVQTVV